ncbi:wall-associated receptor kinase 2-like [Cryptomeria japonica]|uniref:wall-associated receptor kinase 2-like n=1 Tax=Cryptomeria japonica TaxID=3369 RepID=UPI0027DA3A6F|nr:wall-associated receptor kinase 2-like [Cryptomeria japonica]
MILQSSDAFKILGNKSNVYWGRSSEVSYGLRLNLGIGLHNCSCSSNAECIESPSGKGHVCRCLPRYEGNGYLNGTDYTDIEECSDKKLNMCVGEDGGGSVSSFVGACLGASFVVWWLKKCHLKVVEAKYFQQLQQHITYRVGRESLRMFSAKELAGASKKWCWEVAASELCLKPKQALNLEGEQRFLSWASRRASKKWCWEVVASELCLKPKQALNLEGEREFLNEIIILSQINHKNVVKLLGCCIQTKFPLLVSEFVHNGTLFEHLHSKEGFLSWASRLQIVIETAEALAYLHSGVSQTIFHRDVKSSNILLNERLSPKLVDFGISRLMSLLTI